MWRSRRTEPREYTAYKQGRASNEASSISSATIEKHGELMASVEIGKNIPVVTAPPVASNRAAANQSVLPSIRQAAEQFADAKSATVRQITDSAEKVHKALDAINDKLHQSSTSLAFSVDSDSQRMVIRVTDQESGEVLFTFPGEAALKVAAQINKQLDSMKGILFDNQS